MGKDILAPLGGDGLMASVYSVGGGGADDSLWTPDDTHYLGYDSVNALFFRPRNAYISRGVHIGDPGGAYNPVLEFASVDGAPPALTVGGYAKLNVLADLYGFTKPLEVATAAGSSILLASGIASGAGSISIAAAADVNAASINATHKIMSWGWINNANVYTEVLSLADGVLTIASATNAAIYGTKADAFNAIALVLGSTVSYATGGARILSVQNAGIQCAAVYYNGDVTCNERTDGQVFGIKSLTELTTIDAAATTTTAIQIPANALVVAVSARVTTVIPTAATVSIGVTGDATRYANAISAAATTTAPGTLYGIAHYAAATNILITPDVAPAANTGRMRITIHYIEITPPTT